MSAARFLESCVELRISILGVFRFVIIRQKSNAPRTMRPVNARCEAFFTAILSYW